ncbi:MAG: hypothetical protein Q9188_007200 [Gyalolechia gomerana]
MASSSNSCLEEFARLYPNGSDAENALDLVWESKELDQHHRQFITVEPRTEPADSSGDEFTSAQQSDSSNRMHWSGYYALSLKDPVKRMFQQGWLMGRGVTTLGKGSFEDNGGPPKGVDLLLIRPGEKTYGVTNVHARISFHPQSGVLMVHGTRDDKPVKYMTHDASGPVELGSDQAHVLYQKSNLFYVGQLQYVLVFSEFSKVQYLNFAERRNKLMQSCGLKVPHAGLLAFGWITCAVHSRTGEPLAIKEQRPRDLHDLEKIEFEVRVGKLANSFRGLLPIRNAWCEHQFDGFCTELPQNVFSSSPLALYDFSRVPMLDLETPEVLDLFRGPLEGLVNLHHAGIIHRDIHIKNLFVMSMNPAQAVLGDFGKAVRAERSSYAFLGPAYTVAPEVDTNGKRSYDSKIDVWSFGIVMLRSITNCSVPRERATTEWHDGVLQALAQLSNLKPSDRDVVNLISSMLDWDPRNRPSASEALAHPILMDPVSILSFLDKVLISLYIHKSSLLALLDKLHFLPLPDNVPMPAIRLVLLLRLPIILINPLANLTNLLTVPILLINLPNPITSLFRALHLSPPNLSLLLTILPTNPPLTSNHAPAYPSYLHIPHSSRDNGTKARKHLPVHLQPHLPNNFLTPGSLFPS